MNKVIPILAVSLLINYLVFSQNRLETVIQKGHELSVTCSAVSADSFFVATGSKDKSIKLWELETGREIRSLLGHDKTVSAIDFSSDGKLILSGSYDKKIILWDVVTGRQVFSVTTHEVVTAVSLDPKMRFFVVAGYGQSGGQDSATVFDFKTKSKLARLPVNADQGRGKGVSMSISADGTQLAFGEDNRVVNVYNTSTWQRTHSFEFKEGWCGGCSTYSTFSPEGKYLYMVSHSGQFKKYDLSIFILEELIVKLKYGI